HGQVDPQPGLGVHQRCRGLARLGPSHAVDVRRVVNVHRRPTQAKVPVLRKAEDQKIRGPQDEVGRGDNMVARRRLHAGPASCAAKGGVYDIMSSETRRIMSTPPPSDEENGKYDLTT